MPRTEFVARVLNLVRRIPPGRVATYGDIARLAGYPGAARAVGNVMATPRPHSAKMAATSAQSM